MVCIYCGNKTDVINSRPQKRHNKVWRRRRCTACEAVFTTSEAAALAESLMVRSGSHKDELTPFMRDKLFLSIYNSCQHRPSAVQDATALTDTVISRLPITASSGLLRSSQLKNTIMTVLTRFDGVAAVHYAAFHKN